MKSAKYLLIGGGLASARAAKRIRELDAASPITIVGAEPHAPYDHPPLSKDFMQLKTPVEKVYLDPPGFYASKSIALMSGEAVTHLDAARKVATLAKGESIAFEKALLATGGTPIRLKVPGADLPNVHTFRTLDDAMIVSRAAQKGRRAAIIGDGFIGLELASSFAQRGVGVDVVGRSPHIWSRFADARLADYIRDYCAARGVTFHQGQGVGSIAGNGHATGVVLTSGEMIACDFVIMAVGIEPDVRLAAEAGLKIDNGVVVDEFMRTSHPDIYAAGDIANYPDPHSSRRRRVEHWGQADYTGALAGANMAGQQEAYSLLTYVFSDIFDLHLEFAGDESGCEQTLTRGRMESNSFAILYLKGGRMSAFFAINMKRKEFKPFEQLIEQKIDLRGKEAQLQDTAFDLKTLFPQPVAK